MSFYMCFKIQDFINKVSYTLGIRCSWIRDLSGLRPWGFLIQKHLIPQCITITYNFHFFICMKCLTNNWKTQQITFFEKPFSNLLLKEVCWCFEMWVDFTEVMVDASIHVKFAVCLFIFIIYFNSSHIEL
jgi:hypothetical protein